MYRKNIKIRDTILSTFLILLAVWSSTFSETVTMAGQARQWFEWGEYPQIIQTVPGWIADSAETLDNETMPAGMVYREVPEYKYAVFTHHGKLDHLGETYEYIYNTWLPQSGLEVHPDKFDMELYDERFIPDSDDSAFDIYVAIL